ncbi:MAG: hypothetical protein Tsb0010_07490 [Parvularculaceae bacterium]
MLDGMTDDPKIVDFSRARAERLERAPEASAAPAGAGANAPARVTPIPKPRKKPKSDRKPKPKNKAPLSQRARAPDPERARARKRRKVLREIDRINMKLQESGAEALSDWEREFLDSIKDRLEDYSAAFRDPDKGARDEALSFRQTAKLREVKKKSKSSDAD